MKLQSLTIQRRQPWQAVGDPEYSGELKVANPNGEVKLVLTDEACRQILLVAGDGIKKAAVETAKFLASESQALSLEAPKS